MDDLPVLQGPVNSTIGWAVMSASVITRHCHHFSYPCAQWCAGQGISLHQHRCIISALKNSAQSIQHEYEIKTKKRDKESKVHVDL